MNLLRFDGAAVRPIAAGTESLQCLVPVALPTTDQTAPPSDRDGYEA